MFRFNFVAVLCLAVLAAASGEELYSDKYDDINPLEILENDRLREQYYKCFMATGPCVTADAKFFEGNFSESVVTKCRRCTEKQKAMFDVMITWYTENQPDKWEALMVKMLDDAKKKNMSA